MWYNVPLIGEQMEEISKMSIISLKIINNHLALKVAMSKVCKRVVLKLIREKGSFIHGNTGGLVSSNWSKTSFLIGQIGLSENVHWLKKDSTNLLAYVFDGAFSTLYFFKYPCCNVV